MMVNEFFQRERIVVAEDLCEVVFLVLQQVRRIHQSLVWRLRDLLVSSDISGTDFGLLQEFLSGAEEVTV